MKRTKPGKTDGVDEVLQQLRGGQKCEITLLVVKVFKKGDLSDCNNWRGVTLLPIISKIFCRMLLERIKNGVDKKLRPNKSTTEQIFILRNILEQANE